MSYCLNPSCQQPENQSSSQQCHSCGSSLGNLRDRYRVMKALAKGGFGATFLAQDAGLPGEPLCVIKQLRPSANAPGILTMARELFAREAKTLGKIGTHPQIPRLLDYFEDNQQFYLVQEYINGCTLQEEIKRSGPMSEAGVKQFLSEMLEILQYIHDRQVIHRDIKPANLIRRAEDRKLVMIDFGAVKDQVKQNVPSQPEQTALTAFAVGTNGFAPPEQIAMRPVYASDIYAVGITCLFLLTGKAPNEFDYNPTTGEMLWEKKVHLSNHFMSVLKKMLEASVRLRYQSASEVLKALEMEPYLDSLAKSMVTQPTAGREHNSKQPHQTQAKPSVGSQPGALSMAEAIRARRNKPAESVSVNSPIAPRQAMTNQVTAVGTIKQNQAAKATTKDSARLDANSLLTAYANGRRDFALKNLSQANLQRLDLSSVNFHGAKLEKTNFQGTNLSSSDFGHANLNQANLKDANLNKAYLNHADLSGADLRGTNLSYAYLTNANLKGANLCGANLQGAKITDEQLALAKTNWMTVKPNGKRGLL